jgi:DNA-binding SARP family transcriptional activator
MLWPATDDASARNALKVCISRIRARTACKELIVTTGGDITLSADHVQTDLDRAERLLHLAQEGSQAARHAARLVLARPFPQRYASWRSRDALTARWHALKNRV